MVSGRFASGLLAASVAFTHPIPAFADGDAIVGGIIGGIIGGAIVAESNKKKPRTTTTSTRTYVANPAAQAQRAANREVQVALNYFGFPVGTPDGAIGPRSRSAIAEYQATMGYPATGQLTDYERSLLVSSYHRAMAGGALTAQQAAANPMGMRGLLLDWRNEAAGIAPQGTMAAAPAEPAATGVPQLPVIAASDPAMPSFLGGDITQVSLASHCNKVSLMTATNGGFTTVSTMTDPMQALNEQFCLARTYAIAQGEELSGRIQGFTPQQIADQCAGFGPAMASQVTALSLKPVDAVMTDVQGFALSTGMAPAQLSGTAKICLSVGYRTDNMQVALASAMILATLGEGVYGELMGHHLAQGIGAAKRPDLALGWYELGLGALASGATPAFAPGQPERNDLIRKAAFTINGRAGELAPAPAPEAVPASLPGFTILPADDAEPPAEAVMASDTAGTGASGMPGSKVGALPMAARLPFLLFRN